MMTEIEAQQKSICCFCEKEVSMLTALELSNYKTTALCPNCWHDSIMTKPKNYERTPVQVPLPLVGNMPTLIRLPPLAFGQLVLYRSDLLIDCIIKPEQKSHDGYCTFTVIAPDSNVSDRIAKYLGGNDG